MADNYLSSNSQCNMESEDMSFFLDPFVISNNLGPFPPVPALNPRMVIILYFIAQVCCIWTLSEGKLLNL